MGGWVHACSGGGKGGAKSVCDHNTDSSGIASILFAHTDPDDSSLPFKEMREKGEEFQDELLPEPLLRIYHYFLLRRCVRHFCIVI